MFRRKETHSDHTPPPGGALQVDAFHMKYAEDPITFFATLFAEIAHRVAATQMIVLLPNWRSGLAEVCSRSGIPWRLEEKIRRTFSDYLKHGDQSQLGVHDGFKSSAIDGDFAIYGYRYSVGVPLDFFRHGENSRAVLWLGFDARRAPLAREIGWLNQCAPVIGGHLSCFFRVHESPDTAQLQQDQSEVIQHLSHDIRSPLSNIKAILTLLQLEGVTPENESMLTVALKNCESLGEIVESLLDYTRHQTGKLECKQEHACLRTLVEDVIESFSIAARAKGLELLFECTLACPVSVFVDRRQVKRIVSNLLSNSIKYTAHGSVRVRLEYRPGKRVALTVQDSGLGMHQSELERIFVPFSRFQPNVAEGVGLGMAITKILTERNGGRISVTSERGRGTNFGIEFKHSIDVSPVREELHAIANLADLKILLIDDDHDYVSSLARNLRLYGAEVCEAVSVRDAWSILNFSHFNVLITDATLPEGGAERLIRDLPLQRRPEHIILVSGHAHDEARWRALGCEQVLAKPVAIAELVALLGKAKGTAAA